MGHKTLMSEFDRGMVAAAGMVFRSLGDEHTAFEILKGCCAIKFDLEYVPAEDRDVVAAFQREEKRLRREFGA